MRGKGFGALGATALATAALLLTGSPALAQHGHGHGGGGHAAGFHAVGHVGPAGGFRATGFVAPVRTASFGVGPHVGFRAGVVVGPNGGFRAAGFAVGPRTFVRVGVFRPVGFGFWRPYYPVGLFTPYYGFGSGLFAYSVPSFGGMAFPIYPIVPDLGSGDLNPAPAPPGGGAAAQDQPPPDNAGHLQLNVPENAEVIFDGTKTTQTGSVREFVTPPLVPGSTYSYQITVRYMDAKGKTIEDTRTIRFQPNDWFSIDFTRPAPQQPAAPLPAPKVKTTPEAPK
jgi:uncharacterized protein (TIGR03000 family)